MFRKIGAWLGIISILATDVVWAFPPYIFVKSNGENNRVEISSIASISSAELEELAKFRLEAGRIALQNGSKSAESLELLSELLLIVDSFAGGELKIHAPGVEVIGEARLDDFRVDIVNSRENCLRVSGELKTRDIFVSGRSQIDGKLEILGGGAMNLGYSRSLIVNGKISSPEALRLNGSPLLSSILNNGIVSSGTGDIFLSAHEVINGEGGKIVSDRLSLELGCVFRNLGETRVRNLTVQLPQSLSHVPTLGSNPAFFHQLGVLSVAETALLHCDMTSGGATHIERLVFPQKSHLFLESSTANIGVVEGIVGILRAKDGAEARILRVDGTAEFVDGKNAKLQIDLLKSRQKTTISSRFGADVSLGRLESGGSLLLAQEGRLSADGALGKSEAYASGASVFSSHGAENLDLLKSGGARADVIDSRVGRAYLLGNGEAKFSAVAAEFIHNEGDFEGADVQTDEFFNQGKAEFRGNTSAKNFRNAESAEAIFYSGDHRLSRADLSEGSAIRVRGVPENLPRVDSSEAPITLTDGDARLSLDDAGGSGTLDAARQTFRGIIPTTFHIKGNAEAIVGYMPEPSEIPDHDGDFHLRATLADDFLNSVDRDYAAFLHLDMNGHDFRNVGATFSADGLDIQRAKTVANSRGRMNLRKFCIIEAEDFLNEGRAVARDNSRVVDMGWSRGVHVRFVMPATYYSRDSDSHIRVADGPVKIYASRGDIRNSFSSIMAANGEMQLRAPRGIVENISADLMALGEHSSLIEAQQFINRDLPAAVRSGEFYASGGSRGFLGLNDDRWSIYVCCSELVNQSPASSATFGGRLEVKADVFNRGSSIRAEGIDVDGALTQQDQLEHRAFVQTGRGGLRLKGQKLEADGGKIIALDSGGIQIQAESAALTGKRAPEFDFAESVLQDFDLSEILLSRHRLANDNFTPDFIATRGLHRSIPFIGTRETGDVSLNNVSIALSCLHMPLGGISLFLDQLAANNRSLFGLQAAEILGRSVIPDRDCLFYDDSHLFLRISSDRMKKISGIQKTIFACDVYADDSVKIEIEKSMRLDGVVAQSGHGDLVIDGKQGFIHSRGSQLLAPEGKIYLAAAKQIYETVIKKAFAEYNSSNYGYHYEWIEDVARQAFIAQNVTFAGGEADLRGVFIDAKKLYDETKYMLLTGARERLYYWSWATKKTLLSRSSAGTNGFYDVFVPTLISVDQFVSGGSGDSDNPTKLRMEGVTIEGKTPQSSFSCTKDVREDLPFVLESQQRNWENGSGISLGGRIRVENPLARSQGFFDARHRTTLATAAGGLSAVATTIKLCENVLKTGAALDAIQSPERDVRVKGYDALISVLMNYVSGSKLSVGSYSRETIQSERREVGNTIHVGTMEARCPLSVALCGDYDVETGIIRTKSFTTQGRSVVFDSAFTQEESGLSVDLLKAFVGYYIGDAGMMCSAISASGGEISGNSRQEMHVPTRLNGGLWDIEAENGHVSHSQIIGDTVRAIFSENLTVETLADVMSSSAQGINFSVSGGIAKARDASEVVGSFSFGRVDQSAFQTKINEFAAIMSRGEFILEAKKLITKSAKIGNIDGDQTREHIKVEQRFDEKVAEVSRSRDNSFQLDLSDVFTVAKAAKSLFGADVEPKKTIAQSIFEKEKAEGKSDAEASQTAEEVKEFLDQPEMKEKCEKLKQARRKQQRALETMRRLEAENPALSMKMDASSPKSTTPTGLVPASSSSTSSDMNSIHSVDDEMNRLFSWSRARQENESGGREAMEVLSSVNESLDKFTQNHKTLAKFCGVIVEGIGYAAMAGTLYTAAEGGVQSFLLGGSSMLASNEVMATALEHGSEYLVKEAASLGRTEEEAVRFGIGMAGTVEKIMFLGATKLAVKVVKGGKGNAKHLSQSEAAAVSKQTFRQKQTAPAALQASISKGITEAAESNPFISKGITEAAESNPLLRAEMEAINKAPYHPRLMEMMLKSNYPEAEVISTTMPGVDAKNFGLAGQRHPVTGIVFNERSMPIFDQVAITETILPRSAASQKNERLHKVTATRQVKADIEAGIIRKDLFSADAIEAIYLEKPTIPGFIWHHHEEFRKMQLVPRWYHERSGHNGGMDFWPFSTTGEM